MKAFILAAGFGSRLKPITKDIPKPLIPVLNVPSICYPLALLRGAGIRSVICNVHYHADRIRHFFSENSDLGMDVHISEEPDILGTGGGLKLCEQLLDDEPFLLINTDIIADFNLQPFIEAHLESGRSGSLMLYKTPDARSIGDVGLQNGEVRDFRNMLETGLRSDYIYAGAAVLGPSIFRYLKNEFSSIVDTGFTGLIDNESLGGFFHHGFWHDIGTPESYWRTNIVHKSRILSIAQRFSNKAGMKPEVVSPEAHIDANATVRESVIGSRCRIGEGSVVVQSVVLPGTILDKGTVLERCIAFPGGTLSLEE